MDEVCTIDPHYRALRDWLLGDSPEVRSPVVLEASGRILRDLAELADGRARLERARLERGREHQAGVRRDPLPCCEGIRVHAPGCRGRHGQEASRA
ncbi:MAG: hypothetical protein M9894_16070 [Planctomycetes bacterium]|nr:hypothetical protein [Planctomycetota bacterium]